MLLLAAVVVAAIILVARRRPAEHRPAGRGSDSLAMADNDGDGLPDPLPLRRLAGSPGGDIVIRAIAAGGGWTAWDSHRAAAFSIEGVFFDARGAVVERRDERCTLLLRSPARIRIEAADGSTVMGFGLAGAWGARRIGHGRWSPDAGPGALPSVTRHELTLGAWRTFCLPFNLGDADVTVRGDAEGWPRVAAEVGGPDGAQAGGGAGATDSLAWVSITYPPAAGDTAGLSYRIGFDPETGHAAQVFFAGDEEVAADRTGGGEGGPSSGGQDDDAAGREDAETGAEEPAEPAVAAGEYFLLKLDDYRDVEGVLRPFSRALFRADASGQPLWPVYEQRLAGITWEPPVSPEMFEPPVEP